MHCRAISTMRRNRAECMGRFLWSICDGKTAALTSKARFPLEIVQPATRVSCSMPVLDREKGYCFCSGCLLPALPFITAASPAGLRVLIYSGDHDMCVPHSGSEAWTRGLGLKVQKRWRPWKVNDQVSMPLTGSFAACIVYDSIHGLNWLRPKGILR